ncbi:interleukin-10 receptor subunit beta [Antennarius striatus]|uniref:interleukin-10 receptor subunit beta n=1 Tax=Antennarius striatus TaxID=241820 RepID=UPI0035B15762
MFTANIAVLFVWFLQNNAEGAELTPPQNVHLVTLNTNYTLSWDWNQDPAATFTTQYIAEHKLQNRTKKPKWSVVCQNSMRRSCDLTHSNLLYLGIFVIRVRADLDGRHSDWVKTVFCPDEHADVGPPSKVELSAAGSVLDVIISDPLTNNNVSMKEKLSGLYYHIVYREGPAGAPASGVESLNSSSNLVTLPRLKGWTWYCVRVQSRADFYKKSSSFSPLLCMQTEGVIPWWQIFLYFLASLIGCFVIAMPAIYGFYRVYRMVKATFYPPSQLPPHFRKYFCDSPGSDIPRLLHPDSESELLCDKVTLSPEAVLQIHNPPLEALVAPPSGQAPDSSGRHSRQDSSSSRDSGVYSNGSVFGQQQPGVDLSSVEAETSWQSTFYPDQLTLQDMTPGLKAHPVIPDEGIVDVSV